jgi:hypothetical protein
MMVLEEKQARLEQRISLKMLGPLAAGAVVVVVAFTVLLVHRAGNPVQEYAVLQDQETSDSLVLQSDFAQTFRTGQAFDHLSIWVANWDGASNDSVYDVQILDESGQTVAEGEIIGAEAPCIDAYTIAFERVVPEKEQTYTIQVSIRNPECAIRTDFLYYQSGAWDMYAEGALYAPEEITDVDLAFAVYDEQYN